MTDLLPFEDSSLARARGHQRADAAASRAETLEPGWRTAALDAVYAHARAHVEPFLFEHIPFVIPDGADRRALGHIAKTAERRGWIRRAGFGTDVYGSTKSRWVSLICGGPR